jgi:hypothetical protein
MGGLGCEFDSKGWGDKVQGLPGRVTVWVWDD